MTNVLGILGALLVGTVSGYFYGHTHVTFHTPEAFTETGAALSSFGQPATPRVESMFMNLRGLKGKALERAYLEDMIVYREGEVEVAKLIQNRTAWPELKTFTSNVIISHTRDIQLMKEWLSLWYKNK